MIAQTIEINTTELYTPTQKQLMAMGTMARFVLFGGAVGGGKSAWLCNEAIDLSLDYPGNRGYLCRHELTSFRRTTLLTLQHFLPDDLVAVHHKTEGYYDLINGSRIFYGGLGGEHDLERLKSMDLGWFGIDQCEETIEAAFFILASRLRLKLPEGGEPLYKGLHTANPDPGWPRQRWIEQQLDDHIFIPALPADNPYLPSDYESTLRQLYPPDLVQALLDGDWDVVSGVDYLIPWRDINMAVARELQPEDDDMTAFGIDVARFGDDKTTVIYRHGSAIRQIWEWGKQDLEQTFEKVKPLMLLHQPEHVVVDAIGVGAGLYDRLAHYREWGNGDGMPYKPKFTGFQAGGKAKKTERFANRRAEEFAGLAKRFQESVIDIPDNRALKAQLSGLRYLINNRSQLQIEKKEDIKKRGLPSPDLADGLMLSFVRPRGKGIWV